MLWEFQIFFNLLNPFNNLFFKSFIPPPSLQTLAPKYTNSLTFSISCPLITIFSRFLALILIAFVFSRLILSPTRLASSSSLSFYPEVNFHLIPFSPPPTALRITQSIIIKNKNPDILHPCFTPVNVKPLTCFPLIFYSTLEVIIKYYFSRSSPGFHTWPLLPTGFLGGYWVKSLFKVYEV